MKKTVVLRKVSLPGVFGRLAVPLIAAGVITGFLLGVYLHLADTGDSVRWSIIPKFALIVGVQGLAVSVLITLMAAVYNFVIGFIGGIRLSDDTENK